LSQLAAASPGIDAWLFQMPKTGHALRIEDNPRSDGGAVSRRAKFMAVAKAIG
jgi:hypothetical protein